MRAAVYVRSASSPDSAHRQELDCRRFLDEQGWTLTGVYADLGMSRGEHSRLVLDAAHGAFDVVVALSADRLYRKPGDLEALLDTGCAIVTADGRLDTQRPVDAFIARVMGTVAQMEGTARLPKRPREQAAGVVTLFD